MPFIEVTLVAGRPPERLRALIHELHEATVRALDADPASVRVVLREVPPEHWAAADQTIAERRAANPS
jgi:4-oxalocrotonate tautomerase